MKKDGLLKHIGAAFLIALALYGLTYWGIEHRRTRKGPWEVAFTNDPSGAPTLIVNQPALAIANVHIVFTNATPPVSFTPVTLQFAQPRPVPHDLPLGQCVFMDTTFLPGTIVFKLFSHEIQLIPRVLTIDGIEQPWLSGATISLSAGTNVTR